MQLSGTRLFNVVCFEKQFLSANKYQFSTFRDSCKSILLTADPIEKSNKIIALYNQQVNEENPAFVNSEDDIDYWKTVNFRFPDNVTFKSPKEITNFCKDHKILTNVAILHGICHIEFNAMCMYVDTIGRFAQNSLVKKEFVIDFLEVAKDEAEHFQLLYNRLAELKIHYGFIPVHNTLYENSEKTKDDLLSRIFITSLVAEARGIDSGPRLLTKLRSMQDGPSEKIMQKILHDEEKHVAYGIKWFKEFSETAGKDPREEFRKLAKDLSAKIFPPFNIEGRARANFDESWYANLDQ